MCSLSHYRLNAFSFFYLYATCIVLDMYIIMLYPCIDRRPRPLGSPPVPVPHYDPAHAQRIRPNHIEL